MNREIDNKFDVKSLNRVVCIMSYTSSASCLMSSLMDNHPNILMFPDNVLASFEDFWQKHCHLSFDKIILKFIEQFNTIFDARSSKKNYQGPESGNNRGFTSMGPDRNDFLQVDVDEFQNWMKVFIDDEYPISRKIFFQAMHLSYSKALKRKVKDPIIVFGLHSLTHPYRFSALMEDFSDVTFLTMVRNPLRASGSRFRRQVFNGISLSHFHRMIIGLSLGGTSDIFKPSYQWRAIRMEDLHKNPEQTMRNICNWLDLEWNNSLLQSTVNGKKWWNEKGFIQESGFSTRISSQTYNEYLSNFDSMRLNILFVKKCISWKYKTPWWSRGIFSKLILALLLLFPFKIELITWASLIKKIKNDNKPFLIKSILYAMVIIGGFGLGRLALIKSWFYMIKLRRKEVPLLSKEGINDFL